MLYEVITLYDKVLARAPYEPQAMFNKAVALERLGRTREMRASLLAYMELYPDGAQARQGTQMLNGAGDYTWRNHVVGLRTVTLHSIDFSKGGSTLTEDACASLDVIRITSYNVCYTKLLRPGSPRRSRTTRSSRPRLIPRASCRCTRPFPLQAGR